MAWPAAAARPAWLPLRPSARRAAPLPRRAAPPLRAVPFLTPLGPPLCELPHAHDTHVAVAVAVTRVRLAGGRSLALVAPTVVSAVETMHALLGEEARCMI